MLDARSKATVTISSAAGLFNFSESQLKAWEKRGLLKPVRTVLSQDSKTSKGHRQFSPDALDKLALLKILMTSGSKSKRSGKVRHPQSIVTISGMFTKSNTFPLIRVLDVPMKKYSGDILSHKC